MPKLLSSAQFFFSQGISRGVLHWLVFRQSISTDGWIASASKLVSPAATDTSDAAILSLWLRKQPGYSTATAGGAWLASIAGALLGALAITGACGYSGSEPVNIWLLLGLFALLPLLFTVIAGFSWCSALRPLPGSLPLTAQVTFRPLLKSLYTSSLDNGEFSSRLLKPWLLWKLQWLAVAFQISVLATFYLIVLFQDLAFAWSSTVVAGEGWMTALLQMIAWPWQWLMPGPSAELIHNSQYYRGSGFNSQLLGQWWSYIVLAMTVYGLLPRLLLALWMRYRVGRMLRDEIDSSGDIAYFFNALRNDSGIANSGLNGESVSAGQNISPINTWHSINRDNCVYLSWQWVPDNSEVAYSLGLSRWQEDESWVKKYAPNWPMTAIFLVTQAQTPTAELADIIALAKSVNSNLQVELAVIESGSASKIGERDGAYASWQLFANTYAMPITLIACKQGKNDD